MEQLKLLNDVQEMRLPEYQPERLRLFRRVRGELFQLESIALPPLCRWSGDDERLNLLADRIAQEIRYPLQTPVISCLAQGYYHTYPELNLVYVPLAESKFLLQLPDLYHELGHSLLASDNDPKLEPLQLSHVEAVEAAYQYLAKELQNEDRGLGPKTYKRYLLTWLSSWLALSIEFFCDLFAVYTLGAAFAWTHLHLCFGVGQDPFQVPTATPTRHPVDAARMTILLQGLKRLGFNEVADMIEEHWTGFLAIRDAWSSPEYRRCFPEALLEIVAEKAYLGTRAIGCSLASPEMKEPMRRMLNRAWEQFWRSHEEYVEWEKAAVSKLQLVGAEEDKKSANCETSAVSSDRNRQNWLGPEI